MIAKNSKQPLKFRFAPSPNGLLHIGHAYSAILNEKLANELNGSFHLRIEDIDSARSKDEYISAIYRDLHWLGLNWPTPVRHQSEHFPDYKAALAQLDEQGLIYPCFATRGEIKRHWQSTQSPPKDPDGALLYPGLYRNLLHDEAMSLIKAGTPYALRLNMEKAIKLAQSIQAQSNQAQAIQTKAIQTKIMSYKSFEPEGQGAEHPINPAQWGDVILARKDIPTSYHLSVVVDDAHQGITHICRGKDLEKATDVHRLLQILLGFPAPLYHHHELVEINGEKLSKSKSHPSLFELRERGNSAQSIRDAAKSGVSALTDCLDTNNL